MTSPAPTALSGLSPREAVVDTLERALLGIDSNDKQLFESAWVQDESIEFNIGSNAIKGWTAYREFSERLFHLATTHISSNVRVELQDGADKASLTAQCLAYHIPPETALNLEDTSYTVGSLFYIDLLKDHTDGLWKFTKFEIKPLWSTGDRAVLA